MRRHQEEDRRQAENENRKQSRAEDTRRHGAGFGSGVRYSHTVRFRQVYRSGHDLLDRRVHQHRGVMGASGNITAYVLSHHDMHNDLQEALRGGDPDTAPLPLAPATIAQRMVFRLFGPRKWLSGSTKLYLLKQATIRPEVRPCGWSLPSHDTCAGGWSR